MNRAVTARFHALIVLTLLAAAAAAVTGRAALAGLAGAFVAVPALGVALHRWPTLAPEVRVEPGRAVEGDRLEVVVEVRTDVAVGWLEIELELPAALVSLDGVTRRVVAVPAGSAAAVRFPVRAAGWGILPAGRMRLVARDRLGLFSLGAIRSLDAAARVYPSEGRLGGLVPPARTGTAFGAHLSTHRGDGLEYADLRPYRPGDRLRALNWRVSARRGQPWVTERHPDRAADVVVLIDDTVDAGAGDDTTLRRAVRAAMALSESHLGVQDRLGVIALGAPLRWVRPRVGIRQLYTVVDVLLDCRAARAAAGGATDLLSVAGLVAGTTVVALTSLLDERVVGVLADLRRHGHTVVVVEIDASAVLERPAGVSEHLARRLFAAEIGARRQRLAELGVPAVGWDGVSSLAAALARADLGSTRRRARVGSW